MKVIFIIFTSLILCSALCRDIITKDNINEYAFAAVKRVFQQKNEYTFVATKMTRPECQDPRDFIRNCYSPGYKGRVEILLLGRAWSWKEVLERCKKNDVMEQAISAGIEKSDRIVVRVIWLNQEDIDADGSYANYDQEPHGIRPALDERNK